MCALRDAGCVCRCGCALSMARYGLTIKRSGWRWPDGTGRPGTRSRGPDRLSAEPTDKLGLTAVRRELKRPDGARTTCILTFKKVVCRNSRGIMVDYKITPATEADVVRRNLRILVSLASQYYRSVMVDRPDIKDHSSRKEQRGRGNGSSLTTSLTSIGLSLTWRSTKKSPTPSRRRTSR